MSKATLPRPLICGRCERPLRPYRLADNHGQCNCDAPASLAPVPDDSLCTVVLDCVQAGELPSGSLAESLDSVQSMRIDLGTTPAELVGERAVDARTELTEARKLADRLSESELHRKLCEITSDIDDLLAMCADRGQV